ncbi:molybdopterin molybdotransferase MoeA [Pseudodesulfovibrio sp. zrk46]|uniref:molybdopterin molybdotransferase MoeA n=1 Tax=Pseudodesulfovibrio sp. zrk46 TaxID=2725288 RepID=UPI001449B0D9|nr:molybdopterin molybdotransferase MoeA [Pseudodesulfovibrio sp. zrk46]QJB55765.1 molybdopterin molybdotransferase MoeA [Pseudodesulfovibrio sp. zrk46]
MKKNTVPRSRAIRRLLKNIRLREAVFVPPHQAIGLIAHNDISAHCDVPERACSVRDGYAMRSADIERAAPMDPIRLSVTHTVCAESLDARPVAEGCAARVLTGGMVPPCADVVLAEEDVAEEEDAILVRAPARPGWFVRRAGGEIGQGEVITRAGQPITPQAAAVMVRTRINTVPVHPAPTARVISLGSELSNPLCCGEECEGAHFPADNLVLASGLLSRAGADVTAADVLPDVENRLIQALSAHDLPDMVITTGGTGRSERDFARSSALEAGFEILINRVDIRPGRNMFVAIRDTTILFGLPGPPAAVFACFHAMVLPMLAALRGLPQAEPLRARLTEGVSAKPDGEWIVLCELAQQGAEITARPLAGKDTPPMLAIGLAHGVAILGSGQSLLPGDEVEIFSV